MILKSCLYVTAMGPWPPRNIFEFPSCCILSYLVVGMTLRMKPSQNSEAMQPRRQGAKGQGGAKPLVDDVKGN